MTCIVGIKEGSSLILGGDSGAYSDTTKEKSPTPKVWKDKTFLFGWAGDIRRMQLLQNIWKPPSLPRSDDSICEYLITTFASSIQSLFTNDLYLKKEDIEGMGGELLIGVKSRLFVVDSNLALIEYDQYTAIGSGSQIALGSLFSSKDSSISPKEKAALALGAASTHCITVDEPYSFIE